MLYQVARRTGEIGIRMALGASRSQMVWLVLRENLELILAGVGAGVPLTLGGAALARSLLFGVGAADPAVFGASIGVLSAVGLIAGLIPALRAIRIDPTVALRHD
jgi:ABC-type antimicrobial peptide transport system permease subunit